MPTDELTNAVKQLDGQSASRVSTENEDESRTAQFGFNHRNSPGRYSLVLPNPLNSYGESKTRNEVTNSIENQSILREESVSYIKRKFW